MWNEQCDNILQKEFGFYFSSDNASYPNVWIRCVNGFLTSNHLIFLIAVIMKKKVLFGGIFSI